MNKYYKRLSRYVAGAVLLSATVTSLMAQTSSIIRMNAGGSAYTDPATGNSWVPDSGFAAGTTYGTTSAIANTTTPTIYQSVRWNNGSLSYQFALPNGWYQVRLMFAEIYWTAANKRVFNIALNGTSVQRNFDIFAAAGGAHNAVDRTYPVNVTNGQLSLEFDATTDNPAISGIEILPGVRIDAGATSPYTDVHGAQWQADTGSASGNAFSTTVATGNTDSAPLYQTVNWNQGPLQYAFPLANGNYAVTLKFSEIYFTAPGQRVFNAAINGVQVDSGIDVYAQASGANKALDKTYQTTVTNGQLTLILNPVIQNPDIAAIQILPAASSAGTTAPTISVSVAPGGRSAVAGQSQQFAAAVTGSTNTAVSWTLNPQVGTISTNGLYTAPSTISASQTVNVIASSLATPTVSASTTVTLIPGKVVVLTPGTDLASAVTQQPAGTTFLLKAGIHRLQQIGVVANDTFIGESGTVLNGAALLTNFAKQGQFWVASGQTQQGPVFGYCQDGTLLCQYPEDLFVDNKLIPRASSLATLTSGYWYFDYPNANIYVADNPSGHTVETSSASVAFGGAAGNVTISGMIVEKYAAPTQFGAIGGQYPGPGWTITNNEVRLNHGVGILLGSNGQALQNFVHHNGEKGMGGVGNNMLVKGNELSYNNYANYAGWFDCGGGKFSSTNALTVQGNYSHDNNGPGFWTDTDNFSTVYDSNIAVNNASAGIQHEVSFSAVISNNTVIGNGPGPSWLWQSQISIQNSQNVEVRNNTVVTTAANGNGIGIISQNRGGGAYGTWLAINNYVHDNSITYQPGSIAGGGIVGDYDMGQVLNSSVNQFANNAYHVANPSAPVFQWGGYATWANWQADGEDIGGTIDSNTGNAPAVPTPAVPSSLN